MSPENPHKLQVGIPWRTSQEEARQQMDKLQYYFDRVREAGGEPVHISLLVPEAKLQEQLQALDAFVLPGSPVDVDPALYHAVRHAKTVNIDANRDRTDFRILAYALNAEKPVLAICYGCQALNTFRGGTLIQDIASERGGSLPHGKTDLSAGPASGDLRHVARLVPGTRLAKLAGRRDVVINSSHHQAIEKPGRDLAVACLADDGIIEAVEWTGDPNWIMGVQWHPERMPEDSLARNIFRDFIAAVASRSHVTAAQRS